MKKIIGIFSMLLIGGAMLFNINLSPNSKIDADLDLAGIIATNVANAENGQDGCFFTGYWLDECLYGAIYKELCEPSYMYLCNN